MAAELAWRPWGRTPASSASLHARKPVTSRPIPELAAAARSDRRSTTPESQRVSLVLWRCIDGISLWRRAMRTPRRWRYTVERARCFTRCLNRLHPGAQMPRRLLCTVRSGAFSVRSSGTAESPTWSGQTACEAGFSNVRAGSSCVVRSRSWPLSTARIRHG